MMIDRIGQISHVQTDSRIGRGNQAGEGRADSISLSRDAMEMADLFRITEYIKSVDVTDESRIAAFREKINDPSYINERVLGATADKIMEAFGL